VLYDKEADRTVLHSTLNFEK